MKYPYIKFYVRDWISDAQLRMVSLAARGLWMECLCIMQMAERRGYLETTTGIPLTDEMLARLTGTFKGDLYTCKEELIQHGIPSIEDQTGVWYCRRMVKESEKAEKCSNAGKKGGGNPALNTIDKKPETRNHISLKVTFKGHLKGQFDEFWKAYPRKIGKPKALVVYERVLKTTTHEAIMEGLAKHVGSDAWTKDGGQFIPHPTTWLNREGWNDQVIKFQAPVLRNNFRRLDEPAPASDPIGDARREQEQRKRSIEVDRNLLTPAAFAEKWGAI